MKYCGFLMIAIVLLTGAAYAATPDNDQAAIRESLVSQGFSKWKRVELDNGVWEVDDAIDGAGRQFDLRVDAKNMKLISKVAE